MNSRIFLVVDQQGATGFESQRLRSALAGMDGITNWKEGADTIHSDSLLFQCELHRNGVKVMVRVSVELLSLYIDGDTDLCCDVAIELQHRYSSEVFVYAEESLPNVVGLSTVASSEQLVEVLRLRGGDV